MQAPFFSVFAPCREEGLASFLNFSPPPDSDRPPLQLLPDPSRTYLTCDKTTGTWDAVMPQCRRCAPGYFNTSGECRPCSVSPCPRGRYRGECGLHCDAVCKSCLAPRPPHSHFTSGGVPFDVDNCSWACDLGFRAVSTSVSTGNFSNESTTKVRCEKLPGIDLRQEPTDTDEDG